ncbi:MAG TPA: hypothetical protein VGF48_11220 [Thermoanaerobaculia bacterium]
MYIDHEGLQVAYLGTALAHWLDLETGDIVDLPLDDDAPGDPSRFRRIPTRTDESEAEDRRLFVEQAKIVPETRAQLKAVVDDASAFRRALSGDRTAERLFFSFKNDQATRAIDAWLIEEGLAG